MTRAPKVGDYVVLGAWHTGGEKFSGTVHRIGRVTASTAWLDDVDYPIKVDRSKWCNDPWWRVTYVSLAEAKRWLAADAAIKAWRKAIPAGAQWTGGYYTTVADRHVVVADRHRVDTAEQAEKSAAIYVAVAAWLRAKPSADDLLITVECP